VPQLELGPLIVPSWRSGAENRKREVDGVAIPCSKSAGAARYTQLKIAGGAEMEEFVRRDGDGRIKGRLFEVVIQFNKEMD
jgi:hypothetical protein